MSIPFRPSAARGACVDDAVRHLGILRAVDDDGFDLDVEGAVRRVAFEDVASARTVVDWSAELKGARR